MNLEVGSEQKVSRSFELVLQVRNNDGKPTGRTKTFATDDAVALERFFVKNSPKTKKKKKKSKAAKTHKEVSDALKEVEQHTKMIRRKRKLED